MPKWINVVPLKNPQQENPNHQWFFCEDCIKEHGIVYSTRKRKKLTCDFCDKQTLCYSEVGFDLGQLSSRETVVETGQVDVQPMVGSICTNCDEFADIVFENKSWCYLCIPNTYWEMKSEQYLASVTAQAKPWWKKYEDDAMDEDVTKEPEYIDHGSLVPQPRMETHDGLLLPLE